MNMQNIQILFLLFDNVIKLAPWRIVTETMQRIGYGAREGLAQSLGVAAIVGAVLYAFPPTSIVRAVLTAGYFGVAMLSHLRIGTPLVNYILCEFWLGLMVWGGLWLCHRNLRTLLPLRN